MSLNVAFHVLRKKSNYDSNMRTIEHNNILWKIGNHPEHNCGLFAVSGLILKMKNTWIGT